jgi:apolipoprotein N-acyltransferase
LNKIITIYSFFNTKLYAPNSNPYDLGIAFLGGIAMGLAVEPVSFFPLAWIGLAVLWFLVLKNQNSKNNKIFFLGLSWGYGYHGFALLWLFNFHPLTWMGVSWINSLFFATAYWLLTTTFVALFVAVWASTISLLVSKNYNLLTQIFTGMAIWCGLEWLFRQSSFWWTSLSLTQSPQNLWILQLNQISGPETSVAVIVLVNGLLANFLWSSGMKNIACYKYELLTTALFIFISAHLLGMYLYYLPVLEGESVSIGVIQGNIPYEIKFQQQGIDLANSRYLKGYKSLVLKGADAVLTPELALPYFGTDDLPENELFLKEIKLRKIPFWIGTRINDSKYEQIKKLSLISIEELGITSQYAKTKLVPFGEYLPFRETIVGPLLERFFPFGVNHLPGDKEQLFDTSFGKVAIGICYESAFSQIFLRQIQEGGKFIAVTTADGLFGESMMRQHHAQDVMRAIETKRWLVRANSTNYSGVINYRGDTVWLADSPAYLTKMVNIKLSEVQTIYACFGNWLTPTLLTLSLSLLIFHYIRNLAHFW